MVLLSFPGLPPNLNLIFTLNFLSKKRLENLESFTNLYPRLSVLNPTLLSDPYMSNFTDVSSLLNSVSPSDYEGLIYLFSTPDY